MFRHPEDLERMGRLCRYGHLRPAAERGVHPGPPRREYELNPAVLGAGGV